MVKKILSEMNFEVFLKNNFCYHLIRSSNSDSVYCMPCRCPKQVWMYFNRQNCATMSPQLPYLQFLFVALLLLQKDITCCFLDIDLTYVPGNRSKISKGCNAGSSEEEGDKVFRPQEN